jgi:hypothetical protein
LEKKRLKILIRKPDGRDHVAELSLHGRKILKCNLNMGKF